MWPRLGFGLWQPEETPSSQHRGMLPSFVPTPLPWGWTHAAKQCYLCKNNKKKYIRENQVQLAAEDRAPGWDEGL